MERDRGLTDTVLLMDNYGETSQMLCRSFRNSGFKGPVIVIEDDGFFPEDVISVYQYLGFPETLLLFLKSPLKY